MACDSSPLPIFVNNNLLEYIHAYLLSCCLWYSVLQRQSEVVTQDDVWPVKS